MCALENFMRFPVLVIAVSLFWPLCANAQDSAAMTPQQIEMQRFKALEAASVKCFSKTPGKSDLLDKDGMPQYGNFIQKCMREQGVDLNASLLDSVNVVGDKGNIDGFSYSYGGIDAYKLDMEKVGQDSRLSLEQSLQSGSDVITPGDMKTAEQQEKFRRLIEQKTQEAMSRQVQQQYPDNQSGGMLGRQGSALSMSPSLPDAMEQVAPVSPVSKGQERNRVFVPAQGNDDGPKPVFLKR